MIYDDGTHVSVNDSGNTVVVTPDGTTRETTRSGNPVQGGIVMPQETVTKDGSFETFTLSNGEQVPRTGPDGQRGQVDDKGGISYGDGTYITTNPAGNTVVVGADGTSTETTPGGHVVSNGILLPRETVAKDGENTFTMGNGLQVPRTGPDGEVGVVDDKGGITYGDGTYAFVDENGDTVMVQNGREIARASVAQPGTKTDANSGGSTTSGSTATDKPTGTKTDTSTSGNTNDSSDSASDDDKDNKDDK